ncbi:MAG: hypothetical protein M1399_07845 [Actinobacteria bacterium]|nr:hypothetical protein [Actinomycetota bacterium]MCL5447058.1 hypothetical protein [Actinomycetota bacterium]
MLAAVWTLIGIILAALIAFVVDARQGRRSLQAEMGQVRVEMGQVRVEMGQVRVEMANQTARVDTVIMHMATKEDLNKVEANLKSDIHRVEGKLDEHLRSHSPETRRQSA